MTNLDTIKQRLSNYDYMAWDEYESLKNEIKNLSDKEAIELHDFIDLLLENEPEIRAMCESDSERYSYYRRTRFIYKLLGMTGKVLSKVLDEELAKPIEVKIAETETDVLLELNTYEVNGTTMTQELKNLVEAELTLRIA